MGTWPRALKYFQQNLDAGKYQESAKLSDGRTMKIEKVYPLDVAFDKPEDVPEKLKANKNYVGVTNFTISEVFI